LGTDVYAIVSLMVGCTLGSKSFGDTPTAVWEMAVQKWLMTEEDEGVLAATAYKISSEDGGGGDAT